MPSSPGLTAVDLFAGGGGLTVGLKRAGFRVVAAVEIERHAFATYKANHPEVQAFKQDISTISGKELLACSPTSTVDLLAGCPPCQGFSSLTSKYRKADPRNELVSEMGRLVEEMRPRVVMMENVPGLTQKGKPLFDAFLARLTSLGYIYKWDVLQVANYGIPQSRRRLVLLAGLEFPVDLPHATHARAGAKGLLPWRTLRDVLMAERKTVTFSAARAAGGPQAFDWHVVRDMSAKNRERLSNAKPGEVWMKMAKELRPTCHQDEKAGFSNVYGRLRWDHPSVTITAGCTTLSKGRFGHPEQDRTLSVREAATLQTFPDDYVFDTPYMEYACNIIGNALPCDFASIVARQCVTALNERARPNDAV